MTYSKKASGQLRGELASNDDGGGELLVSGEDLTKTSVLLPGQRGGTLEHWKNMGVFSYLEALDFY